MGRDEDKVEHRLQHDNPEASPLDRYDAVARLRERDGDALIYGSRTLWTDLLAHGLIDELHLMIGPRIVAGDHPVFAGLPQTDLRLMGVRTWRGSDNVVLSYELPSGGTQAR